MRYLIDTHTFLWFNEGASEISQIVKSLIENKETRFILVLQAFGKFRLSQHWENY
jgi:PIN domain nuclease of toxin-antitoxin system